MAGAADRWWRECGGCGRMRRLAEDGMMGPHRRWDPESRQMVACEAGGTRPGERVVARAGRDAGGAR
jgi:hypothetical protein